MRISRRFLSSPVILTRRYGSGFSNLVPLEATVSRGEMSPASGCPYICGSLPYRPGAGPLSGVGGTGVDARRRFGIGALSCGVVGHDGAASSEANGLCAGLFEELNGSNIVADDGGIWADRSGERDRVCKAVCAYVITQYSEMESGQRSVIAVTSSSISTVVHACINHPVD